MRPREFDHDEVLRVAFEQFWRKGVRGTSLSDIGRDAGVQRGSLYNAFGSKEALFLCAYQRYASEYLNALQKTLGSGTLRERLTAFLELTIKNFRSGSPPRGCPTTRGLMELGSVEGEGLDENVNVITGEEVKGDEGATANPFIPQFRRGGTGGGGGGGRGGRS